MPAMSYSGTGTLRLTPFKSSLSTRSWVGESEGEGCVIWGILPDFLLTFPVLMLYLAVVQGAGDDGDVPRQSADLTEVGKHLDRD